MIDETPLVGDLTTKNTKEFADELTKVAVRQLAVSNKFKQPLLEKWKKYEDLKAGNVPKKLRVQFNVALPVFSGMLDTLAADFDEPVELRFKQKHPSDYFKMQKIQAAWDIEKSRFDLNARWDYKSRVDKSTNILYGRSILKEYAESNPKYKNHLDNVLPAYFHCQPNGGGLLENHLFAGEEGIMRSVSELQTGDYDKAQVSELLSKANNSEHDQEVTEHDREKLSRFRAVGLDPQSNSYIGEQMFNLVEWVLQYKGERWYLLFEPWTATWLRCERLKDVFSKDLYPWVSWATFEDQQVFWTPAYADIIYPVADSIVTLYNQELTNREKRNMGARAYDKDMFPDVSKLDQAQYRADALVPVDTKGGTRQISNGIYYFQTPELQGTIDLLGWTDSQLQKQTGVTDISQGVAQNASKRVNVAYMEQSNIAKRLGYKSQSYTEAWGEIGVRFVQGLKDHMSEKMYIEVLGDMGIEPDIIQREDLDLKGELSVEVISSTAEKANSEKKRQARIAALGMLAQSQNINSEMRDAAIMRHVGEFTEEEIKLFLDTRSYASKESVAKGHIAIQELLAGREPMINYAADSVFLKVIMDYMTDHHNKLGDEKLKRFAMYIATHTQHAMENGQRAGKARAAQNQRRMGMMGGQPGQEQGGMPPAQPMQPAAPQPEMTQVA